MTIIRCKQTGCEKLIFESPIDLQDHMEDYHNPEAELERELGIEFVDTLPGRGTSKGFDLDKRVLKVLEAQPGVWCKVWTAQDDNDAKTRGGKATALRKKQPQLEVVTRRYMGDWCIFAMWKET